MLNKTNNIIALVIIFSVKIFKKINIKKEEQERKFKLILDQFWEFFYQIIITIVVFLFEYKWLIDIIIFQYKVELSYSFIKYFNFLCHSFH